MVPPSGSFRSLMRSFGSSRSLNISSKSCSSSSKRLAVGNRHRRRSQLEKNSSSLNHLSPPFCLRLIKGLPSLLKKRDEFREDCLSKLTQFICSFAVLVEETSVGKRGDVVVDEFRVYPGPIVFFCP